MEKRRIYINRGGIEDAITELLDLEPFDLHRQIEYDTDIVNEMLEKLMSPLIDRYVTYRINNRLHESLMRIIAIREIHCDV